MFGKTKPIHLCPTIAAVALFPRDNNRSIQGFLSPFLFRAKARQSASEKATDSLANRIVPEIEHLLPDEVLDFGSHTVAVTTLDGLSLIHI